VGTSFTFAISLHNRTNPHFVSGNFHINFEVTDSSDVLIHQQDQDCAQSQDLLFLYSLKLLDIPPGPLTFSFKIRDSATNFVHTVTRHSYKLVVPIVASEITFTNFADQAPLFKIGDTVEVSIVPGTFPDMRTVFPFSSKDLLGKDVSKSRHFFLDVQTASGLSVTTVPGIPFQDPDGKSRYQFQVVVKNNFASIGTLLLSFRYSSTIESAAHQFKLLNYDSKSSDLFDETFTLNYTVNADLELVDVQKSPSEQDFYYGNEIEYEFSVKDIISGSYVVPHAEIPSASVYLAVSHLDPKTGNQYTSAQVRPIVADNVFKIGWEVSPNSIRGSSFLTLLAYDADNNQLPIYATDSTGERSVVSKPITIGGEITVNATTRSITTFVDVSPFAVDFTLSCNGKPLKNALLRATVFYFGEQKTAWIGVLPVAVIGVGRYSVSWTLSNEGALPGIYRVFFHRHSDDDPPLSQLNNPTEEQDPANLSELFQVAINHEVDFSGLPIRTEFLVLLLLLLAYIGLAYRRFSSSINKKQGKK